MSKAFIIFQNVDRDPWMTVAKKRKYFFPETLKSLPKWETFSCVSQDWNELETSRIGYYDADTKYCRNLVKWI